MTLLDIEENLSTHQSYKPFRVKYKFVTLSIFISYHGVQTFGLAGK